MHKAISTVIASILMLMIVIGLGGTTYLYVSGVLTGKIATTFELIDSVNDTVTIRNSGTNPITRITATLDGNDINIAVTPNIQGLVSYWSFNEGICPPVGTCATDDSSTNNNIGRLTNGPSWVDGRYGKALNFDGIDDFIDVGNDASLKLQDFTISFWINERGALGEGLFGVTDSNNYGIKIYATGSNSQYTIMNSYGVSFENVAGPQLFTYQNKGWVYVTITRENRVVKNYINGDPVQTGTFNFDTDWSTFTKFQIANGAGGTAYILNGILDEVAIFNRALSEGEIDALHSGLVPPGQLATVKPLASLSKGTHTLRLCTSSMCNTAILTIV